jgi:predicted AlkP superfamily phosphohydrolase/phosphomutase
MRLLVIGFDGATFDVIQPLIKQNRLPNLARLMQEGAWGRMNSTIPPFSPSAWRTFATGKNPGQHGVFDFQTWQADYSQEPRPAQWQRHKTIWRLLSEADKRVISVDVPFTYPPENVNGLMITGYPTPRKPGTIYTHPLNLPQSLKEAGFDLKLGWPKDRIDVHPDFFAAWRQVMDEREALLLHLFDDQPWDLFAVVFGITDTLAHTLWDYLDPAHPAYHHERAEEYRQAFYEAYEQADRVLGKLWAKLEQWTADTGQPAHLLVLSDHGFGSIRPPQWLVRFLVDHNWLHFKQKGGPAGQLIAPAQKMALRAYTEIGWLRKAVRELRPNAKAKLKNALSQSGMAISLRDMDPSRSLALPSDIGTHIYLNRSDRFNQGLIKPSEAEQYAKIIGQALLDYRDPVDGEPVISAVYLRDDIYSGEAVPEAPDLVLEYANRYHPDKNPADSTINPALTGGHAPDGILLAWGPGVQAGHIKPTEILHMAPTMLHLLAQAIPPDMDGSVMTALLKSSWLAEHPIQHSDTPALAEVTDETSYTEAEKADIETQLRALGYIE